MSTKEQKILIGETVSKKRQERKLTQAQVSEITGLSRNYISDIENGRYAPSVDALSKLAKCLNIDLNFLSLMTEIQV
ncbi:MAG TPA: helix-turn-helix transcriptional regulator [Desulfosporosinus sp.]|nr:helix-turn-helix transcriptional regulator [Desulfosporosinus sp.]